MAERFGYSLDVGKSLDNEDQKENKAEPAKEETKEEVVVDQESASVSDDEENQENNSQSSDGSKNENSDGSEGNSGKESGENVDSEDFGEPIVDDSDEEVTGEMLSANKVRKDILDEIKEDVEGVSEASGSVRADNDIEDLEDDKEVFNPTSEEAYAGETPVDAVEPEHVADGVVDSDGVSAGAEVSSEEESYVSEEKPISPEEADVKDMVDESFKANTEADAILEKDQTHTSSVWKWGVGILILIVLTFVVVKFGFIGPVDNTPSSAVPVDDETPSEIEDIDSLVTDVIPSVEEEVVQEEPVEEVVPVGDSKEIIKKDSVTIVTDVKEKDPEQLLSILKEGLE